MKTGYWFGLNRKINKIIFDNNFLSMEEFMERHNVYDDDLIGPFSDASYCRKNYESVVKCVLNYLHGSPLSQLVAFSSNGSSYESEDLVRKLNYNLRSFYELLDESLLP